MKSLKVLLIPIILLAAISLIFSSCGDGTKSAEAKEDHLLDLQDDVIRVHDDVMPLTANINRARQKIMDYYQIHHEGMDSELENRLGVVLQRLNDAYDDMFDWMGDWADSDQESMDYDKAVKYYEVEMKRIKQVAEDMKSSVKDAEELLAELGLN
jgi:predicted  nucleic acid-binding Zn-ribbon protein